RTTSTRLASFIPNENTPSTCHLGNCGNRLWFRDINRAEATKSISLIDHETRARAPHQKTRKRVRVAFERTAGMADRGAYRGGRGQHRGGGRGGRGGAAGGAGGDQSKERPKKENILDLSKYMDKRITVKFNGGRE